MSRTYVQSMRVVRSAGLCALLASFFPAAPTQGGAPYPAQEKSAPHPAQEAEKLQRDLDIEAKNLIDLILGGEPSTLVSHCSERGVAFGTDTPPISKGKIERRLARKEGTYCVLFDTQCLQKIPAHQNRHSYRDLMAKASSRKLETHLIARDPDGTQGGWLRVSLAGGPLHDGAKEYSLEFEFRYEHGKWKLLAVPY